MRSTKTLVLTALAFALVQISGIARSDEPVKLRVSWTVVPFEVEPVLFMTKDVMTHLGKSYTIELPRFQASSSMLTSLASGDLDIASLSAFTFNAAIRTAGMTDLRLIADEYEDGVDGYFTGTFRVLKDGPVHKIEDMKGKVFASFGLGSASDMSARLMLRRHGLEDKRDYQVIEANGNNMPAMLYEHKVDLINTTGFTSRDPELIAKSDILFTRREAFGGPSQETVWAARSGFLAKNRAAVVDYLEDTLRALNWCLDPKNHDAAVALVAAFAKAPAERFQWMFTGGDEYRDPNGMPKVENFQHAIDVEHDMGLIANPVDVKQYLDLSLVEEAAARLK